MDYFFFLALVVVVFNMVGIGLGEVGRNHLGLWFHASEAGMVFQDELYGKWQLSKNVSCSFCAQCLRAFPDGSSHSTYQKEMSGTFSWDLELNCNRFCSYLAHYFCWQQDLNNKNKNRENSFLWLLKTIGKVPFENMICLVLDFMDG